MPTRFSIRDQALNAASLIVKNDTEIAETLENYLFKNGMTDAVLFGPDGNNLLPAAALYKKNILALRGRFRPVTKVNEEMYLNSLEMFLNERHVDKKDTIVIFEITMVDLTTDGEIDENFERSE